MKEQFNDCVESVKGAWEYTRDAKTGQISIHYYKPDGDKPYVSIHITQDDLEDLQTLFEQIEKCGSNANLEIERKFLLKKMPHAVPDDVITISQWYSKPEIEPSFRVRMSMSMKNGVSHTYTEKNLISEGVFIENERAISNIDYINYRDNCDRLIKKIRSVYLIFGSELKWEVDNYYDFDLIVAEIELPTLDHAFEIEPYMKAVIDKEVTGDKEYFNSKLAIPSDEKVPKKEYLVWWTTEEDAKNMQNLLNDNLSKSAAVFFDYPALSYIADQFASRYGRSGRGRLWVDDSIPVEEIDFDEKSPAHKYCLEAGGIVIRKEDADKIKEFPGIITDCKLQQVFR